MNLRVLAFSFLIVAICYANSVPLPFVQSDDWLIVAANQRIRSIAPLRYLSEPYWAGYKFGGIYRPLTIFSFSIDYALWQRWAPGFRLTNLVLHALNGWLVFLVASTLIGISGAWAAAAVYVIHPVHTEAIVGIVGRAELLAAMFFFMAWLTFRRGHPVWTAILFLLALLSKESAIVLPAVLLLDRWLLPSPKRSGWVHFLLLAAVASGYLGLRFYVLGELGMPETFQYLHGGWTPLERWMTSGRAFLQYFKLSLAPVDVAANYEFNSIHIAYVRDWDAWAGLVTIAGLIGIALYFARKLPAFSFALLFFFIALLPVSNWIMPTSVILAERFLYTPVFSVALLAGIAWTSVAAKRLQYMLAAGVLVPSVLLCISHNYIWQDEFTLFRNMVRVTPDNLSARLGYGLVLQNNGLINEASEQFEAGLRIDPDSPPLLASMAGLMIQKDPHNCDRVGPLLDRAFRSQPNHWESFWMQGNCYALKGERENAEASLRQAVEYAPVPNLDLLFSWGTMLEQLGKRDAAIDVYRRAASIDRENKEVERKLTTLLDQPSH